MSKFVFHKIILLSTTYYQISRYAFSIVCVRVTLWFKTKMCVRNYTKKKRLKSDRIHMITQIIFFTKIDIDDSCAIRFNFYWIPPAVSQHVIILRMENFTLVLCLLFHKYLDYFSYIFTPYSWICTMNETWSTTLAKFAFWDLFAFCKISFH